MSKIYFQEKQKFNQWWIHLIVLIPAGIWIWQMVQQIFMGVPFGQNPAPDLVVILIGIIPVGAFLLFRYLTLETLIDENGVNYRFKPFQKKFKTIRKEDIDTFEVKKYNPLLEYGGWGIRTGSFRKGTAYNVSGNMGALFVMKNGKKFMLGTQNPETMRSALIKLMRPSVE